VHALDEEKRFDEKESFVATPKQFRRRGRWSLIIGVVFAALTFGAVMAYADDGSNNLDTTVDATLENMPLTVGGADGSVRFHLAPTNTDAKSGCNLTGAESQLVLGISSDNTSVATLGASSVTITGCDPTLSSAISVHPVAAGTATITLSFTSVTTGSAATSASDYNLAPASFTVTVTNPVVPNTPPTVDAGGPYPTSGTAYEGNNVSISGTASDPDSDPLTYKWTYAVNSADPGTTCSFPGGDTVLSTTVNCTDNGTFTLTLTATGDPAGPVSDTASLTLANAVPIVTLDPNNPQSVNENATTQVTYNYSISDAGSNDTVTGVTTSCGANGTKVALSDSFTNTSGSFKCIFPDGGLTPPGTDTDVSASATDDNGGASAAEMQTVNISNVAPSVNTPTWAANPIPCTTQASLSVSWTDPASTDDQPFSGQIDWGDTTSTPLSGINAFSLSNQMHTYAPGTYNASVDVTDNDSGTGSSGNSATLTVNQVYTVAFLQPLDSSTPAKVIGNTVKKGRVVPVKAIITDACTGNYVTNPTANVTIVVQDANFVPNATDAVETFSDAGSSSAQTQSFRWTSDSSAPGGGFWIYNLDTTGFSVGTVHNVYVKVGNTQANTNYADIVTTK
jgi:hypothetical protein